MTTGKSSAKYPGTYGDIDTPLTSASSYNDNYLLESPLSSQSPQSPRDSIQPIDDPPTTQHSTKASIITPLSPRSTNLPTLTKPSTHQKLRRVALPAHPAIHKETHQRQATVELSRPRPRRLNLKSSNTDEAESFLGAQYVTPRTTSFPPSSPPRRPSKNSQGPLLARKTPPMLNAGLENSPFKSNKGQRRSTSLSDDEDNSASENIQPLGIKGPPPPLKLEIPAPGPPKPDTQPQMNKGLRGDSEAIFEGDVYGGTSTLSHNRVTSPEVRSSSCNIIENTLDKSQQQEMVMDSDSTVKALPSQWRRPHSRKSDTALNVLGTMASQSQPPEIAGESVTADASSHPLTDSQVLDATDTPYSPEAQIFTRLDFPTPPLTSIHFHCYQSHRYVKASKNKYSPVPCMICHADDFEIRWKCGWCCLRICTRCMQRLDHTKGRDLKELLDNITQAIEGSATEVKTEKNGKNFEETAARFGEDDEAVQAVQEAETNASAKDAQEQRKSLQIDDLLDEYATRHLNPT